jgi:hypothetical protein
MTAQVIPLVVLKARRALHNSATDAPELLTLLRELAAIAGPAAIPALLEAAADVRLDPELSEELDRIIATLK